VVSIALTLGLVWYQRRVLRQTQSVAIKADSLHYLSDLLTNASILVALILAVLGFPQADAIMAIGIGLYIFYIAIQIWMESVQHLLDRELPEDEQKKIQQLAMKHADVLGVHGLRTRQAGHQKIIQ